MAQGVDTLADCPYNDNDYTTQPDASQRTQAANFKAASWAYLGAGNTSDIKAALISGPIVAATAVYWGTGWDYSGDINAYDVAGSSAGGHAICIVGYDDNHLTKDGAGAFRFINSWGSSWGHSGYGWISYQYAQNYFWETDTMTDLSGNTDATLSDLQVNGTQVGGFSPTKLSYNVVLPAGTTKVPTVTATANDTGKAIALITPAPDLPGATTVVVTAEDGITTRTYTINFTEAQANSSDATLKGLIPSYGSLSPVFDASTMIYSLSVANGVSSIKFTPTVNEIHAAVTVNGVSVISGSASGSISLAAGVTTAIPVVVTTQDGTTSRNYLIKVSRAQAGVSNNATLKGLKTSSGSLDPVFAGSTTTYTLTVGSSVSSINLTPTVNESHATIKVNGVRVTSGRASGAINLVAGVPKTITVVVTAQDGITTITYTINATRAIPSKDASLISLIPSSGTLNPAFTSGTTTYALSVGHNVTSIRVTPSVNESHATIKVNGVSITSGRVSGSISLTAGVSKTITVVVTAQDGVTKLTYTITVTRAK